MGSFLIDIEDGGVGQETFEPTFISIPMSRSGNSCAAALDLARREMASGISSVVFLF
jgi:hypothetical protein